MDGADRVSPFDPSAIARVFERELANADFDDHSDLLAIAGPTIYTSIMVAQVLARYGRAKLLLYDARATRYVSRDVELPRPISGGTE